MTDSSLSNFDESSLAKEFKVNPEGKVTCSISGLAKLNGTDKSAISRYISGVDELPVKLLEQLNQYGFEGVDKAWASEGIPDLACTAFNLYYVFDAREYAGKKQAIQTLKVTAAIGFRTYGQKLTGWKPEEPQRYDSIREFVIHQLPAEPAEYRVRFPEQFWEALEELYGLRRGQQGCASFINAYIYNFFPAEVRQRLDEINPLLENGKRANKQHQHFDDVLLRALIQQIDRVITAMQMSPTKFDFRANMARLKPYVFTPSKTLQIEGE